MAGLCHVRLLEERSPATLAHEHPLYSMESLRVMPPVPVTVRIAAKTDYIDGALVPKGTLLCFPVSTTSHRLCH